MAFAHRNEGQEYEGLGQWATLLSTAIQAGAQVYSAVETKKEASKQRAHESEMSALELQKAQLLAQLQAPKTVATAGGQIIPGTMRAGIGEFFTGGTGIIAIAGIGIVTILLLMRR